MGRGIFRSAIDLMGGAGSIKSLGHHLCVLILMMVLIVPPTAFGFGGTAFADTTDAATSTDNDIGYSVYADIPDNQIDKQQTYFDLKMQPGQIQDLRVLVTNETDAPIKVTVSAISASTNRNGIIDYRTPGIKDATLKIPFSEIATVSESSITVAANSSYPAVVEVKMPSNSYDGVVLGGINITRESTSSTTTQDDGTANIQIENVYSYVVGVKLTETDVVVAPDFEYVDAVPTLINFQPAVVLSLRNKEAAIVKGLALDAQIYKAGTEAPIKTVTQNVDMAPNSVLPLSVLMDSELTAGDYYAKVNLELDGKTWHLEGNFSVSNDQIDELYGESVVTDQGLPWWALLMIVFGIIAAIACLILIILLLRRRRREVEEDEEE